MGDRLRAGIPSRAVASQLGQLSLASLRGRLQASLLVLVLSNCCIVGLMIMSAVIVNRYRLVHFVFCTSFSFYVFLKFIFNDCQANYVDIYRTDLHPVCRVAYRRLI